MVAVARRAKGDDRETGPYPAGITKDEAHAMLVTAFEIFQRWGLSNTQARTLLGEPSLRTFQRWKGGDTHFIPADTIWRLGDIMGIHKALRYMFSTPDRGYEWMRRPNLAFGGKSALDRALAGAPSDLAAVRNYLDAERGAW